MYKMLRPKRLRQAVNCQGRVRSFLYRSCTN